MEFLGGFVQKVSFELELKMSRISTVEIRGKGSLEGGGRTVSKA